MRDNDVQPIIMHKLPGLARVFFPACILQYSHSTVVTLYNSYTYNSLMPKNNKLNNMEKIQKLMQRITK